MFEVYKHTNKHSGKSYIGYTKRGTAVRLKEHFKAKTHFGDSLRKNSIDGFDSEILGKYETLEQALKYEISFIEEFDTLHPNGYNHTTGGEVCSCSKESNSKKSKSLTGLKKSPEHCEAISKGRLGMVFTEEHCKNISEAQKRLVRDVDVVESFATNRKGKTNSTESNKKNSLSHIGVKSSRLARDNMSKAQTGLKRPISSVKSQKETIKGCRIMNNSKITKRIMAPDIDTYIDNGWHFGGIKSECPHCKKMVGGGSGTKYHFKNCDLNDDFWEEW